MIDLTVIAPNLVPAEPGLWCSPASSAVAYPETGHDWCRQIEDNSFWFTHRNNCIIELLRRFPPAGAIFDIGAGNGFVSLGLNDAGFEAVPIEPGHAGAYQALARGLNPVICATLDEAGFRESSLPAAGLFDVLEHIEHDSVFLDKIHRLLIPGGRLFVSVPAYRLLWSIADVAAQHQRRYTITELSDKLTAAGYSVEFATYLFFFLPLPIFLSRTIPSLLGLRKRINLDQGLKEHRPSGGLAGRLLNRLLGWELNRLISGRKIPFGGSCLVIAHAD
jgi:SAM-dependent methyltransferase